MAFMIQTGNLKFQAHICLVTNLVLKLWVELYDFYQFIYHVKIALSICKSLVISAKMLMWLFSLFSTCHVTWMISFYRLWDWTFFGSALLVGHSSPEACFLLIYQPFSAQTRSFFSIAVCFLFFAFFFFFLTCHIKFSCQENPDYKKIVLNLFLWNT